MKTIIWLGSVLRARPEERESRRPIGRDPQAFRQMLEEYELIAKWADELGIEGIGSTEHHLQTEGGETVGNALLLYSKLAARTKKIIFMPLSIVLPSHDPIRVAEDIALFSHLHPGRLQVCFARGYQTRWMQTLTQRDKISSTPMDPESDTNNRERFDEYLEVIEKAWTEDAWSYEGKHYQAPFPISGIPNWPLTEWSRRFGSPGEVDESGTIRKIGVVPKPMSLPRIFFPYTVSKKTVIDAARRGHSVLVYDGHADGLRAACELYRDEANKAGHDVGLGQNVGAVRKLCVGDTFEEAFELAVTHVGYWYNNFFQRFGFNESLRTKADDPNKMLQFRSDRELVQRMLDVGQLICGTPKQVLEKLEALRRCHSDGQLEWIVWELWGQGAPGDVGATIPKRQLELYGRHILPHIR